MSNVILITIIINFFVKFCCVFDGKSVQDGYLDGLCTGIYKVVELSKTVRKTSTQMSINGVHRVYICHVKINKTAVGFVQLVALYNTINTR